ncbi:phosphoglycerate kinase, partial [bacterium]|nr:phosphoglycerate kinase [bacterium]
MKYPTLDTLNVTGKTVFVRVDFNVSLDEDGNITDDARIRAALPTLNYLREKGAKLVLASHLGRPKGEVNKKYSLLPVAKRLAELLETQVVFPEDCVGMEVKKLVSEMRDKGIVLLENLRFHKGETSNDINFSEKLASLADIYVNDAF